MGVPRLKLHDYPLAAVLAVVVLFVLVEIGQLIGRLLRFLVRQFNRVAPPRISAVIAVLLLVALTIGILNGVVLRFAMHTLNSTFQSVNNEQSPTAPDHADALRLPRLLVSWSSLEKQGHIFVAGGPSNAQLSAFNGSAGLTDSGIRRAGVRRRHQRYRGAGRARTGTDGRGSGARSSRSPPRPGRAGSTRPRPMRSSTCSMATARSSACSTYSCLAGCLSWWTRRTRARPVRRCSRRSTSGCGRCRRASGPSSSCSARAWGRSAVRHRSCRQQHRSPHRRRAVQRPNVQQHDVGDRHRPP